MSYGEFQHLRYTLCHFFQDRRVKVCACIKHKCLTYIHAYIYTSVHNTYITHIYIHKIHAFIHIPQIHTLSLLSRPLCKGMYIHTYIYVYIHTYMHTYIHKYIHQNRHTCMPTYIYTYMPTYIHTYIHTYMPTYIHT
jgi:hypothetical protein